MKSSIQAFNARLLIQKSHNVGDWNYVEPFFKWWKIITKTKSVKPEMRADIYIF